jgi:hypothetical protein
VLIVEASNANIIAFGLTQPWMEPTIYHTRGQLYNTETVHALINQMIVCFEPLH